MKEFSKTMAAGLIAAVLGSASAAAQGLAPSSDPAAGAKPGILAKVGIDQRIGEQLPLDLVFTDETGRPVKLGDYFGKRPVILALVYYECPMLCTQVLNGLVSALGVMNFDVGREFDVVAVSFNPKEGPGLAAQKKAAYLERYKRPQTAPRLALSDRHAGVDRPAHEGGRVPLRVRREDRAVRARRGHRGDHAAGHALEGTSTGSSSRRVTFGSA